MGTSKRLEQQTDDALSKTKVIPNSNPAFFLCFKKLFSGSRSQKPLSPQGKRVMRLCLKPFTSDLISDQG